MQDDGYDFGNRSGQGTWRGYAQIALIVIALGAAFHFARAPNFRGSPGDPGSDLVSGLQVVDVVVPLLTEQALTVQLTGSVSLEATGVVKSEVEGRIVRVSPSFSNGGSIAAGQTLLRIDPVEFEFEVEVPIEPRELAYLEPAVGQEVRLTGQMGIWAGEIVGISPTVNPTSRRASVHIEFATFESMDFLPPPGTFLEISIDGPALPDV